MMAQLGPATVTSSQVQTILHHGLSVLIAGTTLQHSAEEKRAQGRVSLMYSSL